MTIVALGDSTTAGTPAFRSPAEVPPNGSGNEQSQYAYWMMRLHPEWKVLNRGVNGERTDQILRRFDSDVIPFHPQVLIVLAGVNDLYQGEQPDRVETQLKKIYDRAAQEKIFVVACTIIPYNRMGASVRAGMKEVNEWIRAYSMEHRLGFCDLFRVVEDPAHPYTLSGTPDGLHPDVNGYRAMGEALTKRVEQHLVSVAVNKPLDPPFHPAWWCRGPNAQTIWGAILRPTPQVTLHRERWETPDGDFIDVDLMPGPAGSPILMIFHGLEGSARSKQLLGMMALAHDNGWRAVAMNYRGCSGEPNRLRRSYHGGETSDPKWVIERVVKENPGVPIFCVGVSLGANILLKYLGEEGDAVPQQIRAAVAISTPFDLEASARGLEKGFSRTYMKRLVRSMKAKTLAKMEKYPDLADRQNLLAVKTLQEFDDAVTAPVHGFRDAHDYWSHSSSNQFVARIRRPTLLISSKDDPFLPGSAIPFSAVAENHFVTGVFTEKGGHVGFVSGAWPGLAYHWAEHRAIRFFEQHLS